MWQDFLSGLTLTAITGPLYTLGMYFGSVIWRPGDDAWDLLVLLGIMLSASGFFAEFFGSRLSRAKSARRSTSAAGASTKASARERSA